MTTPKPGIAGRIDYASWEKKTSDLTKKLEEEEEAERQKTASALGLDGKHARSAAEAEERSKAKETLKAKKILESYQKREQGVVQSLAGLLGPVGGDEGTVGISEEKHQEVKYVTRDMIDAGKRVVTISDTTGPGKIVLTTDLSNLESATPANSTLEPKSYADDAENKEEMPKATIHRGIIKLNLRNLHKCTVVVKCKIITGTVEISHCDDLTLLVEGDDATVATIQADLCSNLDIQFHDSPSGKNVPLRVRDTNSGPTTTLFWGQDKDDRVFHAGVSNLRVRTFRDGYVDLETRSDYLQNGAKAVGNATAEEVQFVTSVVDDNFLTEKLLKPGEVKGSVPMTEREFKELEEKKSKIQEAIDEKLKDVVKVQGDENGVERSVSNTGSVGVDQLSSSGSDAGGVIEEVYASATKEEIDSIVAYCEDQKAKGNEAFASGEYAQAVLFYTIALDRAADLPDASEIADLLSGGDSSKDPIPQLFKRHVVLSNRSASFLKMGHHEKALKDGTEAEILDPTYVKGIFRKGLALHAIGRYEEAISSLAVAQKIEPKNKQIKQALQFAEVRMQQEIRKRMES
mmetsp:Transcript_6999/g.14487  ORF Transcript_6999/g.14487 Transcript_6999/m.14487 type:complete len:574 (+) Transcript_6999:100-1821(+)|eukprot:CAMPEP_0171411216 /NCGR_PEP_ID=MMETSP0880-20121228/29524_1 /TAXON_ID=67004 /ORGANISM="Thalassiosira weissflogii, Strain CCMP1336" /LENGTH=573 /DNA_ID=CAMNT_0011928247 /DNA_START=16 /DNA_END=1737 /DNA_ORIENTATION=-